MKITRNWKTVLYGSGSGKEKCVTVCVVMGGEQIEINSQIYIYISKVAVLQRLNIASERKAFSI